MAFDTLPRRSAPEQPGAAPTCAVSVKETDKGLSATILLGNLSHMAGEATVHAIAFGESRALDG
jgi:hypothetical protein